MTVGPLNDVTTNKKYNLFFANLSETQSFTVAVRKGMQAMADKMGVNLIHADNKGDVNQANVNLDNAITQKVDFFFEYQSDPEANKRIAQRLKDANMKAIGLQVEMPGFPYYVVDNYGSGVAAGKYLGDSGKKKFGEKVSALILGLPELGPSFMLRGKGAVDGIKSVLPTANITETTTKNDAGVARQVTADFLTSHPSDKVIIWVHVDQNALSALSAVKAAGREKDVLIASMGGDTAIFPELRSPDSAIVGTLSYFPEKWGDQLIPLAVRWLNGGAAPAAVMNPPMDLITKDNVDKLYPR